ncbi:hypothetical protein Bca4012_048728 [Brassica carinata]|uniref:U4/U6.U5 small nuclear ribonucleoprotein 27kDa protein domain-containing protein n=2 Tax=Brassica TaxID=3705 RepID=A0A0D3ALH1_BRAOL
MGFYCTKTQAHDVFNGLLPESLTLKGKLVKSQNPCAQPPSSVGIATMSQRNRRERDSDRRRDRDDRDRRRDRDDRDADRERDRERDRDRGLRSKKSRSRTPDHHARPPRHARSPERYRSRSRSIDRDRNRHHRRRTPSPSPSRKRPRESSVDDERNRKKAASDSVHEIAKEPAKKNDKQPSGGGEAAEEEGMDVNEIEMMKMLGIPTGFDSTKGKHVEGADVSGIRAVTKRQPRQYMNRRGGFNRPLPAERNR